MTDNEIIKALECCSDTANKSCKEKKCPAIKECMTDVDILEKSALYLINRLKGERDCYRNELKYANIEKEALNKLCGEYKAEIEKKDTEIDILIRKKEALRDEISALSAEVEKLQKENKEQKLILEAINDEMNPLPFETDFDKAMKNAKSEAYREFAERFKYFVLHEDIEIVDCKCTDYQNYVNGANQFRHQVKNGIDNTLKELTESKNDLEG